MSKEKSSTKRAQKATKRIQMSALGMLCILTSFFVGIQTAGEMETIEPTAAVGMSRRADINGDGMTDIRDVIDILELIRTGAQPSVEQLQADPDADGRLTIDDALWIARAIASRS